MAARCTTRWKPAVGLGSPARSVGEVLFDLVDIHAAGAQHRHGIRVIDQPEQQMLQRGVFMLAVRGERKGPVQRLFEIAREHGSKPFLHAESRRSEFRAI
jgi:hypothetical protein